MSMQTRLGQASISFAELHAAPEQAFEQARAQPLMVLNLDQPAGYVVSPEWMQRMMDQLADQAITSKARSRVSDVRADSTNVRRIQPFRL